MWSYDAAKKPWRRKVVTGALLALWLTAVGLPEGRAQMYYNGGFYRFQENPSPYTLRDLPPSSPASTPTAGYPDGDSYYPSLSAPASVSRSNYSPEAAGSTRLPAVVSAALPWNQPDFAGYTLSASSSAAPRDYSLAAASMPRLLPAGEAGPALLVVYLPEGAQLWVEGRAIALKGATSTFRSPPLRPGKKYDYTVQVAWPRGERWVTRTQEVTVEAGSIQAVYLRPSSPLPDKQKLAAKEKGPSGGPPSSASGAR